MSDNDPVGSFLNSRFARVLIYSNGCAFIVLSGLCCFGSLGLLTGGV